MVEWDLRHMPKPRDAKPNFLVPENHLIPGNAVTLRQEQGSVVMWDKSNPTSLINMLPHVMQKKVQAAMARVPDLFNRDEHELIKLLRFNKGLPTPTDNRLRLKFWMEYDYSITYQVRQINLNRVIAGLMTLETFYENYLETASRVAWLMCPPTSYLVKVEEALEFGVEQLRDILGLDHMIEGTNKVNVGLARLKLSIVQMLDVRVKGAVVQKTMNVHAIASQKQVEAIEESTTLTNMDRLNAKLADLRRKEKNIINGGLVIPEGISRNEINEDGQARPVEPQAPQDT